MSSETNIEKPRSGSEDRLALRWTKSLPEAPLLTQLPTNSFAAEQYRSLAAQVEERLAHRTSNCPVLAVTSADPGSGKTLTSLNLAITLARRGEKRVILLEGDLWKPTFSSYLTRQDETPGLSDLLDGKATVSKSVASLWHTGVDVIFAGDAENFGDLPTARRVGRVLDLLRPHYEYIVMDTPPIVLSAGRVLTSAADAALVMVRAKTSSRARVEEALSILGPEKVLGLVLNDVRLRNLQHGASGYGAYTSYGAYAAYSAYEKKKRIPKRDEVTEKESQEVRSEAPWRRKTVVALGIVALAATSWLLGRSSVSEAPHPGELESALATAVSPTGESDPGAHAGAEASLDMQSPPDSAIKPVDQGKPIFEDETVSSAASFDPPRIGTVRARLNLRAAPNVGSRVLRTFPIGSALELVQQTGEWHRVSSDAGEGWVHRSGLDFNPPPLEGLSSPASSERQAVAEERSSSPQVPEEGLGVARTSARLDLRIAPNTESRILKSFPVGTTLEVVGGRGDWYRIGGSSGRGWVQRSGVAFEELPGENVAVSTSGTDVTVERPLDPIPIIEVAEFTNSSIATSEASTRAVEVPPDDANAVLTTAEPAFTDTTPQTDREKTLEFSAPGNTLSTDAAVDREASRPVASETETGPEETVEQSTFPVLIDIPRPPYPLVAQRLKAEGTVRVAVEIDEQGEVVTARVLNPFPDRLGFNKTALNAARRAKYRPATRNGKPVAGTHTLVFPFVLSEGGGQ